MYIGSFYIVDKRDVWEKNASRGVVLWKPGVNSRGENELIAVPGPDGVGQKSVSVLNVIGTFGYKGAVARYVAVAEINGTYWAITAEC